MRRTFVFASHVFAVSRDRDCRLRRRSERPAECKPHRHPVPHRLSRPNRNRSRVYIAASTQDADWRNGQQLQARQGIEVKVSPGGSNTLAKQIVNGAAADLFLSADEKWAAFVNEKGFAAQTRLAVGQSTGARGAQRKSGRRARNLTICCRRKSIMLLWPAKMFQPAFMPSNRLLR